MHTQPQMFPAHYRQWINSALQSASLSVATPLFLSAHPGMSQSTQLSSRISPIGTAQLHSAIEGFKHVLNADQRQDFESSNDQPDAAAVLKFTAHLDEINSKRQSRCIATRLQTVLQSVQKFSTIVETFVSSDPKIAALVWGTLKFALLIASNVGSYFEKLSALFMKFGRHCPRYAEYQSLYLDSTRLQSGLCSFYAVLISCCTRAVEIMKLSGLAQVARAVMLSSFESDFGPFDQQLQHWSREVKNEISAALHNASAIERRAQSEERARAKAHRIWHRQRAKETELEMERLRSMQQKRSLLDKLSDHDYNRPWTRARRQCVASTAQWLTSTKQFSDWVADPTSSLLCLTGKLGSGKTVLTASVIAELSRRLTSARQIAYFFCRFDDEASLHATTVLSSLLRQILRPESLSLDQQSSLKNMLDPGPPELTDLESLLKDAVFTSQFIVIDAFDECGEEERRYLLKAFQTIMDLPDRTIKLFLSSRDGDGWRTRKMFKKTHFVSTKLPESNLDLRTMVKKRLEELVKEERLVVGHQDILQEIEDHLLSKAHGMFLWVDLALQDLCSQRRDRDIRAALQRLPIGLPEMYDRLLGRILDSGERILVSKTFHWIACAKRPLSLGELGEAIAIEPLQNSSEPDRYVNQIARIPSWSRGLVVCDEEDDVLQFAHSTIKDFLVGECQTEANYDFHFQPDAADHELGEICVTYLNFSDFERQLVKRPKPRAPVRGQDLLEVNMNVTSEQNSILRTVSKASQLTGEFLQRKQKTDAHFTLPQQESDTPTLQSIIGSHPFFQYASAFWIFHCKSFTQSTSTWNLWNRLLLDESRMLKLEWSPEEFSGRKNSVKRFVEEQQHCGILEWVQTSERGFSFKQLDEIFEYSISKCGSMRLAGKMFELHEAAQVAWSHAIKAAEEGKIQVVLYLLDAINVPLAEDFTRTALHLAAERGHLLMLEKLLNANANVNAVLADHERTALQVAAERGDSMMVKILLDKKADVNAQPTDKWGTALQEIARHGDLQIAQRLLNAGANVNAPPAKHGRTALQEAVHGGNLRMVEKLLDAKACVNAPPSDYGMTALQTAAGHGNVQMLDRLLNAGADVNSPAAREGGRTALQAAAEQGHDLVVDILLNAGANIDAPPAKQDGRTALQAAAERGHVHVVKILLDKGADANALPAKNGGRTALRAAVEWGDASMVHTLLNVGANVNAQDTNGNTALQAAIMEENYSLAEILQEWGAV